jgi:hypothetical protein
MIQEALALERDFHQGAAIPLQHREELAKYLPGQST